VRSGRHAAGALDAAVLRLKRVGRDAVSAVGGLAWACLDRLGTPLAAGAKASAAVLKVF